MSTAFVVSDALQMTRRNLLHYVREPSLVVFSTVTPVMFVTLFGYVFGGAIATGPLSYIDFLMPGIFVQTVAFGATQTGVGLADDLSKGMVDRFRSLPMARSAVLHGRTVSDALRNLVVVLIMTGVGLLMGFRFSNGLAGAMGGLALVVLFAYAFSWISAAIGLSVGTVEAAQSAGFVWVFPLTFASSAFVPVSTMPGWLQAFARINPITITVDALRSLFFGIGPTSTKVTQSLLWMAAMVVVFVPVSVRQYRRIS